MMTAHDEADVVIVGAGIMGLALAWELVERGSRVVCIDRSSPGREASAATAGTLAVQNKPIGSVPLTLRSLRLWRELSRRLDFDVEYEVRGGFRIAQTADDVEKLTRSVAAQRSAGAAVELVEPPHLREEAPYLAPDIQLASFCADDGMVNPFAAVRGLFRACRRAGVRFMLHAPVRSVRQAGPDTAAVEYQGGSVRCRAAVLAAGAWIARVAANAGTEVPVSPRVQQVLITDGGRALFPHVVTHVRGNLTLKQQAQSGKVLVGGGWQGVFDESCQARRLSRESIVGNARAAVAAIPALATARLLRAWTGLEGRSPDKLPLIGPLPAMRNVHALGCASGGLTLAPACALLLAQRLCGEPTELPLDPFSPARFADAVSA